jgi:hypothetical protein
MDLLINFFTISGIFTLIGEFSSFMTYGNFVKDEDAIKYLKSYEKFNINSIETSIISGEIDWSDSNRVIKKIKDGDYISTTRLSLLSKYYISHMGRVPVWSKANKMINELYKTSEVR